MTRTPNLLLENLVVLSLPLSFLRPYLNYPEGSIFREVRPTRISVVYEYSILLFSETMCYIISIQVPNRGFFCFWTFLKMVSSIPLLAWKDWLNETATKFQLVETFSDCFLAFWRKILSHCPSLNQITFFSRSFINYECLNIFFKPEDWWAECGEIQFSSPFSILVVESVENFFDGFIQRFFDGRNR